jgi:hypothetical protein
VRTSLPSQTWEVAILASGPISEHRPCNRLANVPIAGAVASLGVRVQRHPTASLQGTFVGDVPSSAVSLRHRRAIRCGRPNQACASSAIPRPFQKVAGVVFELSVSIWRGVACSGQRRPPRTARPVVAPAAAPRPGSQPRACISRITESMRSAVAFAILCPSRSCRRVILQIRGFTNDIRDARGSPVAPRRTGTPRGRARDTPLSVVRAAEGNTSGKARRAAPRERRGLCRVSNSRPRRRAAHAGSGRGGYR